MRDGLALHRGCEYNRGTGYGKTVRPGLYGGCRVTGIPTVEAAFAHLRVREENCTQKGTKQMNRRCKLIQTAPSTVRG